MAQCTPQRPSNSRPGVADKAGPDHSPLANRSPRGHERHAQASSYACNKQGQHKSGTVAPLVQKSRDAAYQKASRRGGEGDTQEAVARRRRAGLGRSADIRGPRNAAEPTDRSPLCCSGAGTAATLTTRSQSLFAAPPARSRPVALCLAALAPGSVRSRVPSVPRSSVVVPCGPWGLVAGRSPGLARLARDPPLETGRVRRQPAGRSSPDWVPFVGRGSFPALCAVRCLFPHLGFHGRALLHSSHPSRALPSLPHFRCFSPRFRLFLLFPLKPCLCLFHPYIIMALRQWLRSRWRQGLLPPSLLPTPLHASVYSKQRYSAGGQVFWNNRAASDLGTRPSPGSDLTSRQDQEKLVLYRAKWMRPLRVMVRLKIFQLGGLAAFALPLAEYANEGHLSGGTIAAVTAVVGGAGAASAALWYYSRRYVGEMALVGPNLKHVQLSVIDFWGNRELILFSFQFWQDNKYELSAIIPPLKGLSNTQLGEAANQVLIPLDVVGERQFFLSLRHGRLIEKELLLALLHGNLDLQNLQNLVNSRHTL